MNARRSKARRNSVTGKQKTVHRHGTEAKAVR
jgi:hypothetical protein